MALCQSRVHLAIKINASMLSVQEIHYHLAKYVSLPDSWRSKNYAFASINGGVQAETLESEKCHMLIVDESTDITVHKMLVLYNKFRKQSQVA